MASNNICGGRALWIAVGITALFLVMAGGAGATKSINDNWNTTKTLGTNIIGGSYLGGNFWASPNGTGFSQTFVDSDKDGICDSLYTLDSSNIDYLLFVYVCDYPSPPQGCRYEEGSDYNSTTLCGLVLICPTPTELLVDS